MFRFVSDNVGGVGAKRKHSPASCESCKKRHKRCTHHGPSPSSSPLIPVGANRTKALTPSKDGHPASVSEKALRTDAASARQTTTSNHRSPARKSTRLQSRSTVSDPDNEAIAPQARNESISEGAYLRFVGDLSPEASFLANREPSTGARQRHPHPDLGVGVWLGQKFDDSQASSDNSSGAVVVEPANSPPFHLSGLSGFRALYPYLRRECMSVLPPENDFRHLSDLFYRKFDPLFPILHDDECLSDHDPMDSVALKQCVCLVASLDPSLNRHLRLPHTKGLLSQMEFRSCIATALKQSLDNGFIRDKMVLLQVSTFMSFYVDGPNSSEVSAYHCAQAVQLSQTLGLHLGWPDERGSTEKSRRIFWCVWTLDRLNAAANGRPIMIHQQDMNRRVLNSVADQIPSFRLFIRISEFLDQVISQYRPHATADAQMASRTAPSFEDLVYESQATGESNALLATLELYYLAIVILQSRPHKSVDGSTERRLPSSTLQSFCASSIVSIASEDFKSSMTFWPVLPYAVSLAASVAYQNLRNSAIPYVRKRAYASFHASCDILDELSKAFLSARTMVRLAKDTLREVERVSTSRARPKADAGEEANRVGSETVRATSAIQKRTAKLPMSGAEEGPSTAQPQDSAAASSLQKEEKALGGTLSSQTFDNDSTGVYAGAPGNMPEATTSPGQYDQYDLSFSETMDFMDVPGIFDEFDPSFQLNRVDAMFSANLNPTIPFLPEEWTDYTQE